MSPDNPLYHETTDGQRSLIDIHGKPMVQWVIDAMTASKYVDQIYVIGLPPDTNLKTSKPIRFLRDEGSLFDNIRMGVLQAAEGLPSQPKVIVASSDIPALRPDMVDWLAEQVAADPTPLIYYNVITEEIMENRFPNANRSFVHFKDVTVCGGDLNVIDKQLFAVDRPIWKGLTEARKSPLKQVSLLGFGNLILIALRALTLKSAVRRVCKKLSLEARALACPYAEIGMDADKPHQLAILRDDLQGKQ